MSPRDNTASIVTPESDSSHEDDNEFIKTDDDFISDFQSPFPELEGHDLDGDNASSDSAPLLVDVSSHQNTSEAESVSFDEQTESVLEEPSDYSGQQIKSGRSKKHRVFTLFALLMGTTALGLSISSYIQNTSQETYLVAVSETLQTLTSRDSSLSENMASLETSNEAKLIEVVQGQREELQRVAEALETKLNDINLVMDSQSQSTEQQKNELALLQASISGVKLEIDSMTSDLQNTATSLENIRSIARPASSPSINFANAIEGATLESIDRWGNEVFVNLRSSSGDWLSFAERDTFKGWAIIDIKEFEVTFTKAGQNKILKLRG